MNTTSDFNNARALATLLERRYGERYEVRLFEGRYTVRRVEPNVLRVPGPVVHRCPTQKAALFIRRCLGQGEHTITIAVDSPLMFEVRRWVEVPL